MNGNNRSDNKANQGPNQGQSPFRNLKLSRTLIIFLVILAVFLLPWLFTSLGRGNIYEVPYTTFREQLEQNNIQRITVQGEKITGTFKNPAEVAPVQQGEQVPSLFVTYLPSFGDEELFSLLRSNSVEVATKPAGDGSWIGTLLGFLPFLILIWIFYSFSRNMRTQGQNMFSVGKSRARLYQRSKESTTFDDVAGIESAKRELHEIVEYLKNPQMFRHTGAKNPKGVLLVAPPVPEKPCWPCCFLTPIRSIRS